VWYRRRYERACDPIPTQMEAEVETPQNEKDGRSERESCLDSTKDSGNSSD
jgi:hypothetical protein